MAVCLVLPCFNEERRLNEAAFVTYLGRQSTRGIHLVFVNDGSTDRTEEVLAALVAKVEGRAEVLSLAKNGGKAEAVRLGMLHALDSSAYAVVGFWDSDLATPLEAVDDLASVLNERPEVQMVFGARVALLGRQIKRSLKRHYLGRVFATLASTVLEMPIYDTQCGAKLFRASSQLRTVLSQPFLTRWVFDVEILARFAVLRRSQPDPGLPLEEVVFEYPLQQWVDVAGSKVRPTDILRMALGLVRIRRSYFWREWPGAPAHKNGGDLEFDSTGKNKLSATSRWRWWSFALLLLVALLFLTAVWR